LSRVFQQHGGQQYCAIGSVKSNIGHAESAAGIAAVTKVLLQMQHRELVPSLHSEVLNPHIDFAKTPFVVQRERAFWSPPRWEGQEHARIAGISSFGAGGANAHLIIEEYQSQEERAWTKTGYAEPEMIVLSARSEGQLQECVQQLVEVLERQQWGDEQLANIAYTLQVGREGMEERLALIVASIDELKVRLKAVLQGRQQEYHGIWRGRVKGGRELQELFVGDDELERVLGKWIERKKYEKIGQVWVMGVTVPWQRLHREKPVHRISLPTYPFARQHYWVPLTATNERGFFQKKTATAVEAQQSSGVSPVLDHNELLYIPQWQHVPQRENTSVSLVHHNVVLIVASASASSIAKTIYGWYQHNEPTLQIIQVELGHQTVQLSDSVWQCDINDPQALASCVQHYKGIDCLYFVSNVQIGPVELDSLTYEQQHDEISLLRLVKALRYHHSTSERADCYIVTQDNYSIGGTSINPYGGGITGLAYAIAQGDHRLAVRNIDISAEDLLQTETQAELKALIWKEPSSDRGDVVKFKAGSRYKQTFLNLAHKSSIDIKGIRHKGVYVILGGSGTIGKIITRYLMQKYQAHVIWIGRKAETAPYIQEQRDLLQSLGEPPLYIQADVTDPQQMQAALGRIKEHYPTIHGAIFSGLVFQLENTVHKTTEEEFRTIFDVKAVGSINFYKAFEREHIDFLCYFSSAQAFSFSGAANLSAYASGITFADTFAHYLQAHAHFPVGVLNWGFWKSSLEEMPVSKNTGVLEDSEGCEYFETFVSLLQQKICQQIVCMRASDFVQKLMNKENENIAIAETYAPSVATTLQTQTRFERDTYDVMRLQSYPEDFEYWISKLLLAQLTSMGIFQGPGGEIVESSSRAKVVGKYQRYLMECIEILIQSGDVRRDSKLVVPAKGLLSKMEQARIWSQWDNIKESYLENPEWKARVLLIDMCMRALPEILRGNIQATDVLFAESSKDVIEGIYRNNVLSDHFNDLMAEITVSYVQQRRTQNPDARIRIIEVGAGTGSTSAAMFARLQPYAEHIEYCYTDISQSFLLQAKEQFGASNPYVTYQRWNVEKPLEGQHIEPYSYDIAIATNVLHATSTIAHTLRNIKAALKTNGILLINELMRKQPFITLTFGLLDGWWLYKDEVLRIPGSPLLSPSMWRKALEAEGFQHVMFPAIAADVIGQQIVIVESDGLIRKVRQEGQTNQKAILQRATPQHVERSVSPKAPKMGSGEQLKEEIERILAEELSRTLKIPVDSIEYDDALFDYGIDSILAVSFINQVNGRLGIKINTASLFDYTTVEQLTRYIVEAYRGQLETEGIESNEPFESVGGQAETPLSKVEYTVSCEKDTVQVVDHLDHIEELERKFLSREISTDELIAAVKVLKQAE
jgi:acyl carrier protein/SAM-dependent methyltransferase